MTRSLSIAAATIAAVLVCGPALAQDVSGTPSYGATKLNAGFATPQEVAIRTGGAIDAGTAIGGASFCRGFIAEAPDYAVRYTPGEAGLVIAATSDTDTTLVVSGPDGAWHCDDDSGGSLNPEVSFPNPAAGTYLVWVGTYGSARDAEATLSISESAGAARLDAAASPTAGTVSLTSGFLPDPHVVPLSAGGPVDATTAVGPDCRGTISAAPNLALNFTKGATLPLIISAGSERDLTLVVQTPDGAWHCDDDGGEGLNPSLSFQTPASGRHLVWVGTYSAGDPTPATLNISELESL